MWMLSYGIKIPKAYISSVYGMGRRRIYNINLADNDRLTQLTDGMYDYASLALCGDKVIAKRHSMSMGDEIYAVNNVRNGDIFAEAKQLTSENKHIYDQLEMGK